jgi:hypothetical protein
MSETTGICDACNGTGKQGDRNSVAREKNAPTCTICSGAGFLPAPRPPTPPFWLHANHGIIGLAPGPWDDANELHWPTEGYDSPLASYSWEEGGDFRGTGHSRDEWLALADVMIARWTAWRAHIATGVEVPSMSPANARRARGRAPAGEATPTRMTADQIRAVLDRNHQVLVVNRGGLRYLVTEDENADGWWAWVVGDDGITSRGAVAWFGECDWPEGVSILEGAAPDYRALSERIADWLNAPSIAPPSAPTPETPT